MHLMLYRPMGIRLNSLLSNVDALEYYTVPFSISLNNLPSYWYEFECYAVPLVQV